MPYATASEAIRETAASCAAELVRQGWDGEPGDYDIGAMPGDREALDEALGRRSEREEVCDLETIIRAHLTDMAADDLEGAAVRRALIDTDRQ